MERKQKRKVKGVKKGRNKERRGTKNHKVKGDKKGGKKGEEGEGEQEWKGGQEGQEERRVLVERK